MSKIKYIAQGTLAQIDIVRSVPAGTMVYLAAADAMHPHWSTNRAEALGFETADAALRVATICRQPPGGSPARPSIEIVLAQETDATARHGDKPDERALFEAWFRGVWVLPDDHVIRRRADGSDRYMEPTAITAWEAWQAALAAVR